MSNFDPQFPANPNYGDTYYDPISYTYFVFGRDGWVEPIRRPSSGSTSNYPIVSVPPTNNNTAIQPTTVPSTFDFDALSLSDLDDLIDKAILVAERKRRAQI